MAKHDPGTLFSARKLALSTGVSSPTVEKILKQLLNAELLKSRRGAKGGYFLAREPESVSLANIIDLMQGSIALTECTDSSDTICEVVDCCSVRDHWPVINGAVRAALGAVTLRDLASTAKASPPQFTQGCSGTSQPPEA